MNSYLEQKWFGIEATHAMRMELLDTLTDADLAFNPGGQNITLGALLKETGEIEHSYLQSLKTFKQDWAYRNTEAGLAGSVAQIKAWYQQMDDELKAVVAAFSDEDLQKPVERESGYQAPVEMQLEFYTQALFIFFGKAVIYLKAMNKPLSQSVKDYIW